MKKLSKVICFVLSALMLLSLAACGKQAGGAELVQQQLHGSGQAGVPEPV